MIGKWRPCLIMTRELYLRHQFPVHMQAPNSYWTPTLRDKRSTTSYLIVDGNEPPPVASLHLDPLLPEDLWWAPSPGCPPPTRGKEVRSDLGDNTPSTARGKWLYVLHTAKSWAFPGSFDTASQNEIALEAINTISDLEAITSSYIIFHTLHKPVCENNFKKIATKKQWH